jgi:hypothetical protein
MFGSYILDVVFGLIFVYLVLSSICSTINEQIIARLLNLRAKTLETGIQNMLGNSQGNTEERDALVQKVYDHPLIKGLSQNAGSDKQSKPSYIPADIFTYTLLDLNVVQDFRKQLGTATDDLAAVSGMPAALALLIKKANNDLTKEQAYIEKWYNDTMDRVSGWYKRQVQVIILILGILIVVSLNVDTFSIASNLSSNAAVRATVVSAVQGKANLPSNNDLSTLNKDFEQIQSIIGWSSLPTDFWGWVLKITGLLVTIFAISLGAPFWFDVINNFINLRSSGPPPQTNAVTSSTASTAFQLVGGANALLRGADGSPSFSHQSVASNSAPTDATQTSKKDETQ